MRGENLSCVGVKREAGANPERCCHCIRELSLKETTGISQEEIHWSSQRKSHWGKPEEKSTGANRREQPLAEGQGGR